MGDRAQGTLNSEILFLAVFRGGGGLHPVLREGVSSIVLAELKAKLSFYPASPLSAFFFLFYSFPGAGQGCLF